MNFRLYFCTCLVLSFSLGAFVNAQEQEKTASQWRDQIIDAYSKLKRYQVKKQITIKQTSGQDTDTSKITLEIAFDRENKAIAIKTDGLKLTGKDNVVYTQMVPSNGKHLQLNNVNPIDPATLQRSWPMFPVWLWVPDMSLILGTEVQLFLKSNDFKLSSRKTQLPKDQREFESKIGEVVLYLTLDTKSNLFRKAQIITSGQSPEGKPSKTVLDFDIQYTVPQKIDAQTFALNTQGSTPVSSLKEMIQDASSPEALKGKAAPPIVLNDLFGNTFDLSKAKNKIIVLDFWATWCGPCRRAMPEMEALDQWAKDQKLDVAVYTVNLQEELAQVKKFVDQQNIKLPVLMDVDGQVATQYRAFSIPQSVIIVDGKVVNVYTGFNPAFAQEWRKDILHALGKSQSQ